MLTLPAGFSGGLGISGSGSASPPDWIGTSASDSWSGLVDWPTRLRRGKGPGDQDTPQHQWGQEAGRGARPPPGAHPPGIGRTDFKRGLAPPAPRLPRDTPRGKRTELGGPVGPHRRDPRGRDDFILSHIENGRGNRRQRFPGGPARVPGGPSPGTGSLGPGKSLGYGQINWARGINWVGGWRRKAKGETREARPGLRRSSRGVNP